MDKDKFVVKYLVLLMIIFGCNDPKKIENPKVENHDSSVAFAYPLTSIEIDGDVAEWPADLEKYPIAVVLENKIENSEDLNSFFQVGYSKRNKSIYALVTVVDDKHLADSGAGRLSDEQDQCLMYLDKFHNAKGSGVNVFCFNELYQEIDNAETNWDPNARNPNWDNIKVVSKRDGNQTYYEIQISFENGVFDGQALGLDFMIYDNDIPNQEEELTRISWIKSEAKEKVPFKLGTVVLAANKSRIGTIEGKVQWKKDSLGLPPNKIRISSAEIPSLWVRESVDSTGYYSTRLPAGKYNIRPDKNFYSQEDIRHKLKKSSIVASVAGKEKTIVANLELDIDEPLNLLPEIGILLKNPPNKYQQIDDFVNAYMEFYEIPGVSIAIIEKGELSYHQSYGIKNYFTQEEVGEATIFEAASITKPVFAFAVCSLAERGIIDLDKPLYQYLPFEEIAYDDRYKLITARHVLTHKTGFPNWRNGKMTINFEPGTQFGYSGEGFEYLKRVVAHVTEKNIVQVLEEEVLGPLQLRNIYFEKSDYLFDVVANGHFYNRANMANLPDEAGMAWSMHTKAESFIAFPIALLKRKGLKPKTYMDMLRKHTDTDKYEEMQMEGWGSHFGLGIQIEETPFGMAFGHGGNNGDFLCEFKVYDDLDMGFAIFTNSNTGDQLTYQALEQFLITGKFK